jgi:hypothetical protein
MIYPYQPPPNCTLTSTQSSQLPTRIATTNIQIFPPIHQNHPQLHELYNPPSQPITSFKPTSTNQFIPPHTLYTTENLLQILRTQNWHYNTASIPGYSTQKQPNIQQ